jgi:isopentenyl phosphate kinase
MKDLYLLKIGGSVITDLSKPNTVASGPVTIGTLLGEAYEAYSSGGFDLIIGHGSGSFGHVAAAQYKVNEGLAYSNSKLMALITHMTAKQLDDILIGEGIKLEIPLYPFSPANFSVADNGELGDGFCSHIAEAIEKGFIPVVYGDVVMDRSKGVSIASTEKVLDFIAREIKPKKVLYGSDTDGVFTANPKEHPDAEHIKVIDSSNIEQALENTGVSKTRVDVTGGMETKLAKLYETCKHTGAEGYIFNITKPGMLKAMLLGVANPEFYTVVRA